MIKLDPGQVSHLRLNIAMTEVNPVRRPRRWRRIMGVSAVILVLLVIVAFIAGPAIAVQWSAGHLPRTYAFHGGEVVITSASTSIPVGTPVDLQVTIAAGRAREIASAASQWWIPPGLIRIGHHVQGTCAMPLLRGTPFAWEVNVGDVGYAPLLSARINNVDLSDFLRREGQTVLTYAEQPIMRVIYVVQRGHITDVTESSAPSLTRRMHVEASGQIILVAGTAQRTLRVDRLAGHATVTYTPDAGGYRMGITLSIEESEAEAISLPVIGDVRPMLLRQLETAANEGMADGLEKVWLPPWTPLDTRFEAVIE